VRARTQSRLPPFDEIREQVAAEFAAERRRERNDAEYRRMRAHYDVVIERPPSRTAAEPSAGTTPPVAAPSRADSQ
jgi:hypothetical protein